MARNNDESRYDRILERIKNLRLPLLTLDRKWYLLFDGNKPKQIQETENELNEVIKSESRIKEEKQKLNTLKKKLVDQIVGNMNAAEGSIGFRKMEKSRDLIEEINDKLILLENDELDIPLKLREKMRSWQWKPWNCFMTVLRMTWKKLQNWSSGSRKPGQR